MRDTAPEYGIPPSFFHCLCNMALPSVGELPRPAPGLGRSFDGTPDPQCHHRR
jgi:hypothetical protein